MGASSNGTDVAGGASDEVMGCSAFLRRRGANRCEGSFQHSRGADAAGHGMRRPTPPWHRGWIAIGRCRVAPDQRSTAGEYGISPERHASVDPFSGTADCLSRRRPGDATGPSDTPDRLIAGTRHRDHPVAVRTSERVFGVSVRRSDATSGSPNSDRTDTQPTGDPASTARSGQVHPAWHAGPWVDLPDPVGRNRQHGGCRSPLRALRRRRRARSNTRFKL